MAFCPQCGTKLSKEQNFCSKCGCHLGNEAPADNPYSNSGRNISDSQSDRTRTRNEERASQDIPKPENIKNRQTSSRRRILIAVGGLVAFAGGFVFLGDGSGLLSGSETPPLDKVDVQLVDIRSPDTGFTSATLPFIVEFQNPTQQEIPEISGDLDIYINDVRVGSDEIGVNRLKPGENSRDRISIDVPYSDYGEALLEAIRSLSFEVRITGSLHSGGAKREITVTGSI
jgi:LEA14-like dessication related protein